MEQRDLCRALDKGWFERKVKMNPFLGFKEGEFLGRLWEPDPEVEFIEADGINITSESHLNEITKKLDELGSKKDANQKCREYKNSLKK